MTITERKRLNSPHQPTGRWIRPEKRLAIYLRDGFCCVYCGRDLRNAGPREVHLDHITPRSLGGDNDAMNLITACAACNCARGNRAIEDYAPGGALLRICDQRRKPINVALAKALIADQAGNDEAEAAR